MRTVDVLSSDRIVEEGEACLRVKCDEIDTVTPTQFASSGDDSPPLPRDLAAVDDDGEQVLGYVDTKNVGMALPGEKRSYARNLEGEVVGHVYLRRDGKLELMLNATGTAAVAELVNANFEKLAADIDTLKDAIGSGFTAVGVGSAANGPAGKTAFDSAAAAVPQTLDNVSSPDVLVPQP